MCWTEPTVHLLPSLSHLFTDAIVMRWPMLFTWPVSGYNVTAERCIAVEVWLKAFKTIVTIQKLQSYVGLPRWEKVCLQIKCFRFCCETKCRKLFRICGSCLSNAALTQRIKCGTALRKPYYLSKSHHVDPSIHLAVTYESIIYSAWANPSWFRQSYHRDKQTFAITFKPLGAIQSGQLTYSSWSWTVRRNARTGRTEKPQSATRFQPTTRILFIEVFWKNFNAFIDTSYHK